MEFPEEIQAIFASDDRIVRVVEYKSGWVANAYRARAPGRCKVYTRDGTTSDATYDRKRAYGRGPRIVGFSAKNGRLTSR
jgi:hypothetical protein